MDASHAHPLYRHGDSVVHRLPAHVKIVAAFGTVAVVVATPREAFWAFGVYALLLAGVAAEARVPLGWLARRLLIEAPFVALTVALPFLEGGPEVQVAGVSLSVDGLYAAWGILAKGTLGVTISLLLAATTTAQDLLVGLARLRMPSAMVQIATFMVRYLHVIAANARAMRIARVSRCHDPRFLWQAAAFATSVGALFLRSYERGERVYVAMLSRGYTGALPVLHDGRTPATAWTTALALPAAAATVTVTAWLLPVTGGAAAPPSLEVRDLVFAYPDGHQALFGVDLTVERGERVALLGPNGAGKTTLVLHLNGVLGGGAGNGAVRVGGLPVERPHLREIRRRVGIVFQDPDDQLFLPTVAEDVAFGPANLGLRGAELAGRVAEALDAVGMGHVADRAPHHLSFGQRRRVAVATVLAMRPEILVLDEPSSNLDPASRRELATIVTGLDVTLLMVTHDLPYALELCPRAVLLDEGTVVADGPTARILADAELMARHRLELPYGFDPNVGSSAPISRFPSEFGAG